MKKSEEQNTLKSRQSPLGSGFSAASTADEVIGTIDLRGKTAIVTGGYSGIGLETVRVLTNAGATVIVPARNHIKARGALSNLPNVLIKEMDLTDPLSIDSFARQIVNSGKPLEILINCAGIMATPLTRDARGYELQFATNHLGHFQLTLGLWPALAKAGGARVIAVSSRGHRYSPVIFDDVNFERTAYDPMTAYGQSKTANILFALELDKLGQSDDIRAFSLHPGAIVDTGLGKHIPKEALLKMGVINAEGKPVLDPLRQLKTVQQGASTGIWCATNPMLDGIGGVYCENNDIARLSKVTEILKPTSGADADGNFGVMPYAVDPEAAKKLWSLSCQLTNVDI